MAIHHSTGLVADEAEWCDCAQALDIACTSLCTQMTFLLVMVRPTHSRALRLEITLDERLVAQIFRSGLSPAEYAEFVVSSVPLRDGLARFVAYRAREHRSRRIASSSGARSGSGNEYGDAAGALQLERDPTIRLRSQPRWTRSDFEQLVEAVESDQSLLDVTSLLLAYSRRGANPTSGELRVLCGFTDQRKWIQALRLAKTRLALKGRVLGLPRPFPRPQTTKHQRYHPIAPDLIPWLREWSKNPLRSNLDLSLWGRQVEGQTTSM